MCCAPLSRSIGSSLKKETKVSLHLTKELRDTIIATVINLPLGIIFWLAPTLCQFQRPRWRENLTIIVRTALQAITAPAISEWMQKERKWRGRQNACVTNVTDRAINCVFCHDLHLTLICSGLLQIYLFKGRWSLVERLFKQNYYCDACHTRFSVFFPLPFRCISSVLKKLPFFTTATTIIIIIASLVALYGNTATSLYEVKQVWLLTNQT